MTPYLYEHQNPNAPRRSNGKRFWGYPTRSAKIRVIAKHTTESVMDTVTIDTGAENVARYQSRVIRPSSYHRIDDSDSSITTLPDEATAFGVGGFNSPTLSSAFAMRASEWESTNPTVIVRREQMLHRAAQEDAKWCQMYDIPVRQISRDEAKAGYAGFVGHGQMDPTRRSDPGRGFPWWRFLLLVQLYLDALNYGRVDPTPVLEDDMRIVFAKNRPTILVGADNRHLMTFGPNSDVDIYVAMGYPKREISTEQFDRLLNNLIRR